MRFRIPRVCVCKYVYRVCVCVCKYMIFVSVTSIFFKIIDENLTVIFEIKNYEYSCNHWQNGGIFSLFTFHVAGLIINSIFLVVPTIDQQYFFCHHFKNKVFFSFHVPAFQYSIMSDWNDCVPRVIYTHAHTHCVQSFERPNIIQNKHS